MRIAPTTFDRVQYTLSYLSEPSITIKEVKNWNETEKAFIRNTDYDGIVANLSNNLVFVEDGKDYILFIYETYGINAKIFIRREERHPKTDAWVETYSGYLDFETMNIGETEVSLQMSSGGLERLLETREAEQVEVDRSTTLNGATLPYLPTVPIQMNGRKIFLLSKMENIDELAVDYESLSTKLSPPLEKTISSDTHIKRTDENLEMNYAVQRHPDGTYHPERQQFFYDDNDRRKFINLEFDLNFEMILPVGGSQQYLDVYIEIQRWNLDDSDDLIYKQTYPIKKLTGITTSNWQRFTYNSTGNPYQIEMFEGDCLIFIIWRDSPFGRTRYRPTQTDLIITENSFFEPTKCNMILAHDLGSRIAQIITNKDCFYSEALGRIGLNDYTAFGEAEATGFANGSAIRGFYKDETDKQNRYKPLTTSFRDFADAMRVTHNLSVGIERIHKRERIRMEEKSYFYSPNVTIKLPYLVENVRRKPAKQYYFSSLELGFAKGGEYEESMGLDEYNGKSTFTTIIDGVKNVFKAISPYRADSYGAEFARRKTRKYYPLEDTRYDQDIFQFDLFRGIASMNVRKWQDDFEQEPSGVYSPETAYNLRYSPANLVLKHGWLLASSFLKYPLDFIRYGSSTANSNLTTKLIGGVEVSENGGETGNIIQNQNLPKAKFKPEWVTFSHICNFEVMQQVEGTSMILGKKIPNFYGLVEYKLNDRKIERGWLFNLKTDAEGEWLVLTSNR